MQIKNVLRHCGFFVVVGLLGGLLFWNCGAPPPCKADGECAATEYCDTTSEKKCRPKCAASTDCLGNEICANQRCQAEGTEPPPPRDSGTPEVSPEETTEKPQERTNPPDQTTTPDDKTTPPEETSDRTIPGPSPSCPILSRECYSGPDGTKDKGLCKAGKQRCVDGKWSECVGEVKPQPEQCDGNDNNCDGQIDSNCPTWATSFGGRDGDEGNGIAVSTGSVYVTGIFFRSATFGNTTLASKGDADAYIARLDDNGQLLWATAVGGTGTDGGKALATDASGNLYATGYFEGSIEFGAIKLTSKGGKNIYIAKMDDKGEVKWAVAAGGATGGIEANDIAVDKDGNIYISGSFTESADFDSHSVTSKGGLDVFVAKLDNTGKFVWATSAGSTDSIIGFGVAADDAGNSYVTGYYQGVASFGATTLNSKAFTNVFVAKLDNSGKFAWATGTSRSWYAAGRGIKADSSGNVYVTGYFENEAAFGNKVIQSQLGTDIFVTKVSPTGQFLWTISATGYSNSVGRGLGLDGSGNLYLAGSFVDRVSFGTTRVTAQGGSDIYIAKVDSTGKFVAATSFGGRDINTAESIAVDSSGNAYIVGTFRGSVRYGQTSLNSFGYTDAVVAKVPFK